MSTVTIGETPEQLAKSLRDMAVMTAQYSQNWDNYERIVLNVIQQIMERGNKVASPAVELPIVPGVRESQDPIDNQGHTDGYGI